MAMREWGRLRRFWYLAVRGFVVAPKPWRSPWRWPEFVFAGLFYSWRLSAFSMAAIVAGYRRDRRALVDARVDFSSRASGGRRAR